MVDGKLLRRNFRRKGGFWLNLLDRMLVEGMLVGHLSPEGWWGMKNFIRSPQ